MAKNDSFSSVISEIITTEQNYIEHLKILIHIFYFPIRDSQLMPESDQKTIFSCVEIFLPFHEILLSDLQQNIQSSSPETSTIGKIFCNLSDFMKNYPVYVNGYSDALTTLNQVKKENFEFAAFLKKTKKIKCLGGLDLSSYLITPVQRVPRYTLLLQQLLKLTSPNHPDYQDLVKAVEKLKNITEVINESKRVAEQYQELYCVHEQLDSFPPKLQLLEAHRRVILSTHCTLSTISIDPQARFPCLLFSDDPFSDWIVLCNDMILMSTKTKDSKREGQYVYYKHIDLNDVISVNHMKKMANFDLDLLCDERGAEKSPRKKSKKEREKEKEKEKKEKEKEKEKEKKEKKEEEKKGGKKLGKKKDVLKQSTLKNLLGSLDKEIEEEEEKKGTQQKMLLVAEKYGLMTFLFETAEESDVWFRAIQQEMTSQKEIVEKQKKAIDKHRREQLNQLQERYRALAKEHPTPRNPEEEK